MVKMPRAAVTGNETTKCHVIKAVAVLASDEKQRNSQGGGFLRKTALTENGLDIEI